MKTVPAIAMLVSALALLVWQHADARLPIRWPPETTVTKDFPAVLLESKPIESAGLEFVAVIEEEWRAWPHDIVLQWRVKNVTKADILLDHPCVHSLVVCDTQGLELIEPTKLELPRKVLLRPGTTATIDVSANSLPRLSNKKPRLEFYSQDKSRETPILVPDTCAVSVRVHAPKPYPGGTAADARRWSGDIKTPPVSIAVPGPEP